MLEAPASSSPGLTPSRMEMLAVHLYPGNDAPLKRNLFPTSCTKQLGFHRETHEFWLMLSPRVGFFRRTRLRVNSDFCGARRSSSSDGPNGTVGSQSLLPVGTRSVSFSDSNSLESDETLACVAMII